MRRFILFAIAIGLCAAQRPQQQGFNAMGGQAPPPQPLDQVLLQVFDKDNSDDVSMPEVSKSLDAFAAMGGMGAEPGKPSEVDALIQAAKNIAPTLFDLLDADGSRALDRKELKWVARVQKDLKSGALRNVTRDVFAATDANGDDALDEAELIAAANADGDVLERIVQILHEAYPLRRDAPDLKKFLVKVGANIGEEGLRGSAGWMDLDGDGKLDRKEVGKAYLTFKQLFLKGANTLQTMGPMLAMFGGFDPDSMGGGGGRGRGRGRGRIPTVSD